MFLKKISVISFKNISNASFTLADKVNCFVGGNGAGKTNILDAIHYLSMSKSAFGMSDAQSLGHGADFFVLEGDYHSDGGRGEKILCTFKPSAGKKIRRGDKEYERMAEHIGLIPVVIVSPADSALVSDSAEERRRFVNSFLSQTDPAYLSALVRYNHLLAERNKLLKTSASGELMDVIDMQLASYGNLIYEKRAALVERLSPLAESFYTSLSGDAERVTVEYRSELSDVPMESLLKSNMEKDYAVGFTSGGIHRDDLVLKIGSYPLRKYGSQGQQKSLLVALKLAQYAILAEERDTLPILLLDDLFDKLDLSRVERLLRLIETPDFGQVFISDCNKTRLSELFARLDIGHSMFNVTQGDITPL